MLTKQAELNKQSQTQTQTQTQSPAQTPLQVVSIPPDRPSNAVVSTDSLQQQYTHTHLPANLQPVFPFSVHHTGADNQLPIYTWQGIRFDEMPDMKLLSLHCLSARRKS